MPSPKQLKQQRLQRPPEPQAKPLVVQPKKPTSKPGPRAELPPPITESQPAVVTAPAGKLPLPPARPGLTENQVIAWMLWQDRNTNPSLSRTITKHDEELLKKALGAQNIKEATVVLLERHEGLQVALVEKDSHIVGPKPGTEKTGGPNIVLSIGNSITPMEDNEEDLAAAERAKKRRLLVSEAPRVAEILRAENRAGIPSDGAVQQACATLEALAAMLR